MKFSLNGPAEWVAIAALSIAVLGVGHPAHAQDVVDGDDLQAAIDAASPGDTITVGPGTYGPIVIDMELTLSGAQAGADACDRDGTGESVITDTTILLELQSGSAGTVIDGFEFSGGTMQLVSTSGPIDGIQILNNRFVGFTGSGIFLNDNGDDITIDQNLIDGTSQAGGGGILHLDTDAFDGMHITNNCVINGDTGLFSDGDRNVGTSATRAPLLSGNLFEGNGAGANLGRMSYENAVISENTFSNNEFDGLQGGPANSTINENSFTGNGRYGLRLTGFEGSDDDTRGAQDNNIFQNCFLNNGFEVAGGAGVVFDSGQFPGTISTNVLNDNNISGNNAGAAYSGDETIDAEDNWWGAADGPSGDGTGSGDSVDGGTGGGSIDFDPFLTAEAPGTPCTTAALDHFKCYKVVGKGSSKLRHAPTVDLEDQFGEELGLRIDGPTMFCNPVVKNLEGELEDLGDQHLTCYSIKHASRDEYSVVLDNQFGEQEVRLRGAGLLCVPSEKLSFERIERGHHH